MAASKRKDDPTITSDMAGPDYPEGTHPARPASEVFHSVDRISYEDNPEKPDATSVAQIEAPRDE
jgi:hypothetical protein